MTHRRPEIFVSASSSDLRTCRQTVKEGLLTLGCVPIEQANFPPDYRVVRDMLLTKIAACDAVVHLAGECFGAEPVHREPAARRRSYTQMEYDLARELGKPLYVFLCGKDFPYDQHAPEEPEKLRLQQAHRAALAASDTLRCEVDSRDELALRIRELQTNVEHLSGELRKTRSWLSRGVTTGLVVLAVLGGGMAWLNQRAVKAETRVARLETEFDVQRRYVKAVADAYTQQQAELEKLQLPDDERLSRALDAVVQRGKVLEGDYTMALNNFIAAVRANPKADLRDRMLADFAQKKLLAALAAQINPSGTFILGGTPRLLIGGKQFQVGTRFNTTFKSQDFALELVAIDRTSFTLRLGNQEVTRPISRGR